MSGGDDRKAILAALEKGNYWPPDERKLKERFGDADGISTFIWGMQKDGLLPQDSRYLRFLLAWSSAAPVQLVMDTLIAISGPEVDHYGIARGWSEDLDKLLTRCVKQEPAVVRAAWPKVKDPQRGLVEIALWRGGVLPEVSVDGLRYMASAFLELSYENKWYAIRSKLGANWQTAVREAALELKYGLKDLKRLEGAEDGMTAEQKVGLAANLSTQQKRQQALDLLLPVGDEALPLIEARLPARPELGSMASKLSLVAAAIHQAAGRDVPEALDPYLKTDVASFGSDEVEVTLPIIAKLPKERISAMLADGLRYDRAWFFYGLVDDAALHAALVQRGARFTSSDGEHKKQRYVQALATVGAALLPHLKEVLGAKKPPAGGAQVWLKAAQEIGAAPLADEIVALLGSSSKGVRTVAEETLVELGEAALPALEKGSKARKKAIKEGCAALLGRVQRAGDKTPLDEALALPQKHEAAAKATLAALAQSKGYDYGQLLPPLLKDHPHGVVAAVVHDWALPAITQRHYWWSAVLQRVEVGNRHVAWLGANLLAQSGKLASYNLRGLRDGMKRLTHRGEAVAWALDLFPGNTNRLALYEVLTSAWPSKLEGASRGRALRALLAGLTDSSKAVRTVALKALPAFGDDAAAGAVELLKSRKKPARLGAAELLTKLAAASARPALEAARKKEKAEDVQDALDAAIVACGGQTAATAAPAVSSDGTVDVSGLVAQLEKGRAPKLDIWSTPGALGPLKWSDGTELSERSRAGLVGRLKKQGPDKVDSLATQVAAQLDRESAAAWTAKLWEGWRASGRSAKGKWAAYALGTLGGDETFSLIAPKLDWWSSAGKHAAAGWVLDGMRIAGSRVSLSWIGHWADYATTRGLRKKAVTHIKEMAAAEKVGASVIRARMDPFIKTRLEEKAARTWDFDAKGERSVDYGARTLTIVLGSDGSLLVRDEKGKMLKSMPKGRKADDADKAKAAQELFKALKKGLKASVQAHIRRFEWAMVAGRVWTHEEFTSFLMKHPILSSIITGLVFRAGENTLFRLSEDRELLDAEGEEVSLSTDASIKLVHPLEISAAQREAWSEHLSDSEVEQPFPQIGRSIIEVGKGALSKNKLSGGRLSGFLSGSGWIIGFAQDGGMVYDATLRLPSRGVVAELHHGGYYIGGGMGGWDTKLESISFGDLDGKSIPEAKVDPVAYSEVYRGLMELGS